MQQAEIGIIGGSGLYAMPGLMDAHEQILHTPFGKPSAAYVLGTLEGRKVAFVARDGQSSAEGMRQSRSHGKTWRHVYLHGGAAIFYQGGIKTLPQLGL